MATRPGLTGFRAFLVLCLGHVVSVFGSNLSGFVLGVWAYQSTGSVTQFSLISFFTLMPQVVILAVAGALGDRWNRRRVLIVSDFGAAVGTLGLLLLASTGQLAIWHIYVLVAASSVFTAFQYPALTASIPLLLPKSDLVRANGVNETGVALAMMAAPAAAAALLAAVGLRGVLLIDLATFGFAVTTLLAIRIPDTPAREGAAPAEGKPGEPAAALPPSSLWAEAKVGWRFIYRRTGLVALLLLVAASNFVLAMVQVLLTPLVLGFADAAQLGIVLSLATGGMVAGGVLVSLWGGPRHKMPTVLGLSLLQGVILFLGGLRPSLVLVATAGFCFSFCTPFLMATVQAIWQSKVELAIQGRVFAIRRVVSLASPLVAFLLAGPLVDGLFEPWLAPGGLLADSVGRVIGVGEGRGIGLVFILLGCGMLVTLAIAYAYRPLRLLDHLPDSLVDESPA